MNTAAGRALHADLAFSDHLPTCPRCGDLSEPTAERCGCGKRLHPPGRKPAPRLERRKVAGVGDYWLERFTPEQIRQLAEGIQ